LEELEQAEGHEGLQTAIETLRDHVGVDHMIYHWVDSAGDQYGCCTYSDDWVQRYLEQNYLRVDPVIAGCYQCFHPVDWKRLDWSSKVARAFQKEAISYGVGNQGFSVPIHGPNGQFALFTQIQTKNMILIAHAFNRKALDLEPDRKPDQSRALSPREVDAMT
jgi:hypothetical protein